MKVVLTNIHLNLKNQFKIHKLFSQKKNNYSIVFFSVFNLRDPIDRLRKNITLTFYYRALKLFTVSFHAFIVLLCYQGLNIEKYLSKNIDASKES